MDKKSIIGIVVVGLLFLGFVYLNGREQKRYEAEMAEWQAYQDSVNAAQRPAVPADSAALSVAAENAGDASATVTIAASASVETKTRLESLVRSEEHTSELQSQR